MMNEGHRILDWTQKRPRRRPARLATAIGLFTYLAVGGSVALTWEAHQTAQSIPHDSSASQVVTRAQPNAPVETFLLVGSDSRAGVDPSSPDAGGILGPGAPGGQRSDTIMLLRDDKVTGQAALLSLPRDLWVTIAGTTGKDRINAAFTKNAGTLVQTIQNNFHIAINHYIAVDFVGFKQVVDAIGGVTVCFPYATRDANTGLSVATPGCTNLNGTKSLQYTRSRHYEELKNGRWIEDPRSDLDRIQRQQEFILSALNQAQGALSQNPLLLSSMLSAAAASLTLDSGLTVNDLSSRFKGFTSNSLQRYSLPVSGVTIQGKAVLNVDTAAADPILAYFRGDTPTAPAPQTSSG